MFLLTYFKPESFLARTTPLKFLYALGRKKKKREISISRRPISQPQASKPPSNGLHFQDCWRAWISHLSASTTLLGTARKCAKVYLKTTRKHHHSFLVSPKNISLLLGRQKWKRQNCWQALFFIPSHPFQRISFFLLCLISRFTKDLKRGSTRGASYLLYSNLHTIESLEHRQLISSSACISR